MQNIFDEKIVVSESGLDHLQELIFRQYSDGRYFPGFFQFAAGVLAHYQKIELGTDAAQDLSSSFLHQSFGFTAFEFAEGTGKQECLSGEGTICGWRFLLLRHIHSQRL
jgi:hypothetical protein